MSKSRSCPGKEGFQRLNYLYQVSNLLATDSKTHNVASTFYSNLMVNISKKTVQRLDIPIKRSICKRCRTLMLAGMTCKVRIRKKKIVWSCLKCQNSKVLPADNGEYLTWTQKEESLVVLLDFAPNEETVEKTSNNNK